MVFARKLAKGFANVLRRSGLLDPKCFVIVLLGRSSHLFPMSLCRPERSYVILSEGVVREANDAAVEGPRRRSLILDLMSSGFEHADTLVLRRIHINRNPIEPGQGLRKDIPAAFVLRIIQKIYLPISFKLQFQSPSK